MCVHAQSCLTLCNPMNCTLPGFSGHSPRQEYWSGLSFPSTGDLPHPGISCFSYIGRWILYHWATREAPNLSFTKEEISLPPSHFTFFLLSSPLHFPHHCPPSTDTQTHRHISQGIQGDDSPTFQAVIPIFCYLQWSSSQPFHFWNSSLLPSSSSPSLTFLNFMASSCPWLKMTVLQS